MNFSCHRILCGTAIGPQDDPLLLTKTHAGVILLALVVDNNMEGGRRKLQEVLDTPHISFNTAHWVGLGFRVPFPANLLNYTTITVTIFSGDVVSATFA